MALKIKEPIFRNFCFCGSLKTVAAPAGHINVIVGFVGIFATCIATLLVGFYYQDCGNEIDCVPKYLRVEYLVVYIALFTYAVFSLVSGIIYINGIKNNKPNKMKLLMISRIFAVIAATAIPFVFDIFHIILSTIPIIMEFYTLLCLFSYYIILKNELKGDKIDIEITKTA